MELVEGPTLADRIAHGPIPLDEALSLARQIADALEVAHEQGIIHRDLKPGNIKVRPDGTVKVLDFGLAKAIEPAGVAASGGVSQSPTITSPAMMTTAGAILGTAAYMSPEQARGRDVDRRSDIWSFGCVLFEMLAGRRPFDSGDTVSDAVAAVLRSEPEWGALPPDTPPHVSALLRHCLEKDARKRLSHIAIARHELARAAQAAQPSRNPSAPRPPMWRRVGVPLAAAIAGAVVTLAAARLYTPAAEPGQIARLAVPLVTELQVSNLANQLLAVSRDGTQFVYGGNRLHRRVLSQSEAKPIPGSEATLGTTVAPVFSPDGRSIAFVSGLPGRSTIKRIDVNGGPAVTLVNTLLVVGMSWHSSGIVYAEARKGILRVSENGGQPELLVPQRVNELSEQTFQGPRMLPDGQTLLYSIVGADLDFDAARIVAQKIGSAERTVLVEGGVDARYLPTGHLVYAREGVLYAVPFDPDTLKVGGRPIPVVSGVSGAAINTTGAVFYDVADNGTLFYLPGPAAQGSGRTLTLVDRNGQMQALKPPAAAYEAPRLSPDGKFVAVELADGAERNIWIYDMAGTSSMRRLTFGGVNRFPLWSRDGKRVAFQSNREGDHGIFWQLADGTGNAERLTKPGAGEVHVPESWSPRDEFLLLEVRKPGVISMHMLSMRDRTVRGRLWQAW